MAECQGLSGSVSPFLPVNVSQVTNVGVWGAIVARSRLRYRLAVANEITAASLNGHERGLLLALLLLGAEESVLEVVDEDRRERVRRAWRALRTSDETTRARMLAAWRAEARSAQPEGLLGLHPSWIEEALAGERSEVVDRKSVV